MDPNTESKQFNPWSHFAITAGLVALILGIAAGGYSWAYASKVYPSVSVAGVYLGGLRRDEAIAQVNLRLKDYNRELIPIIYGTATVRVPIGKLEPKYDVPSAVDLAMTYGRQGSINNQLVQRLRTLLSRPTNFASFTYPDAELTPYLASVDIAANRPVANATLNYGAGPYVTPAIPGRRLDIGRLTQLINDRLANASSDELSAPIYDLSPVVDTASLESAKHQADQYLLGPLTLTGAVTSTINPVDIVNWLKLDLSTQDPVAKAAGFHYIPPAHLVLDEALIAAHVKNLAGQIDKEPINARLTIKDNRATVFHPSSNGAKLDQAKTLAEIKAALTKPASGRQIALAVQTIKPEVSEDSLNNLGIKELISEGVSYFAGSSAARINNIRLGAALYNGVLVKPGETFSFNQYFINVDAEHGWSPGLSIVGDKIYPIYGGGICQVSSTAYRAALLAGLPIVERTNHAYAVSFYSEPFGVPGVDATVYNPGVDFKFLNDTGSYILIQTTIAGVSLKFDFYGTKTKGGRIRGPFFIDGSSDYTKPSTTIFYRDTLDLAGNAISTGSVTTHYKSSLDFTHVDTP